MAKTQPPVLLKGRKNGITIQLDESAAFVLIEDALRRKVADAREFFAGANTNVTFKGRPLSEEEEKSLLDIIFSETTLDVSFVASEGFTQQKAAGATGAAADVAAGTENASQKEPPEENDVPENIIPLNNVPQSEYNTIYYRHSLRSGQSIRFDGSVVVLGDVNAGSEIIAQGNIIVLGTLRGMAHAGAAGDASCFVSALTLTPVQLRIANIITSIQQEKTKKTKTHHPEYAYIKDGQVYVVRH